MRVGTLQFAPTLGTVEHNIQRANTFLESSRADDFDLLVLPELAFTGYNFPDLEAISPLLEPTAAGPTTQWAIRTAQVLQCYVIVGYPEVCTDPEGRTTNYNSTVTVSSKGEVVSNYRKSFLYYTDETWAAEGCTSRTSKSPFFCGQLGELGNVGHGICMDINPYKFTAPWSAYEFATTMLKADVRLVVLSMAWLTRLTPQELLVEPDAPDMETVAYWLERFFPFLDSAPKDEIIVVFANRCGTEGNIVGSTQVENGSEVEEGDRVCYAGSSCVMRFQGGQVRMFQKGQHEVAVLGKAEEGLLVVNTEQPAKFLLQHKAM
jgi:protein N-terminal amidase